MRPSPRFGEAGQRFAGRDAFMAHLQSLGLTDLTVQPGPVQIATEAALWGSIVDQGLLDGAVIDRWRRPVQDR